MGEGPRDNAARARRHDLSLAVAGKRAGGRAGGERLCSSKFRASRAKLQCKGFMLGMVGEVLHACVEFRGSCDVAPRVQRERRTLPGKLVVFPREPRKKRATHAKFSRTHTPAKTGNFWFCWRCGFHTAHRVRGLAGGVAESCKAGVACSGSSRMAGTRKIVAGWRRQTGIRWVGRTWSRRRDESWMRLV